MERTKAFSRCQVEMRILFEHDDLTYDWRLKKDREISRSFDDPTTLCHLEVFDVNLARLNAKVDVV